MVKPCAPIGNGVVLEFVNAVHALRLFRRIDEAAERSPEFLSAGAMCHASQARTIPVDFTRLRVEGTLLICLLL